MSEIQPPSKSTSGSTGHVQAGPRRAQIEVQGHYNDGRSSNQRPAILALGEDGTVTLSATDGDQLQWAATARDLKISARLANVPREVEFISQWAGGSGGDHPRFITLDNDGIDAIQRAHGKVHGGLIHLMETRYRWVIGSLLAVALAAYLFVAFGIPASAKLIANNLPDGVADSIGEQTMAALDGGMFTDSQLSKRRQRELRASIQRLLSPDTSGVEWKLMFRNSEDVGANAFALPNGYIVVTDDLVELAEDDREIAAVVAHEIGHVVHKHGMRGVIQASFLTVAVALATGDSSSVVTTVPVVLTQLGYSREFEREADSFALHYMKERDLAPSYFALIMRRMTETEPEDGELPAFLSTHPGTNERLQAFE